MGRIRDNLGLGGVGCGASLDGIGGGIRGNLSLDGVGYGASPDGVGGVLRPSASLSGDVNGDGDGDSLGEVAIQSLAAIGGRGEGRQQPQQPSHCSAHRSERGGSSSSHSANEYSYSETRGPVFQMAAAAQKAAQSDSGTTRELTVVMAAATRRSRPRVSRSAGAAAAAKAKAPATRIGWSTAKFMVEQGAKSGSGSGEGVVVAAGRCRRIVNRALIVS